MSIQLEPIPSYYLNDLNPNHISRTSTFRAKNLFKLYLTSMQSSLQLEIKIIKDDEGPIVFQKRYQN